MDAIQSLIYILVLILVANAAPVFASYLLGHRSSLAIDSGYRFKNGKELFGPAKTWRGLISSIVATALVAWILMDNVVPGLVVSTLAMTGDLIASFIKRQFKVPSSSRAWLLDQLPESLFPALGARYFVELELIQVIVIVLCFIMLELTLSIPFYKLGIRKHPY